MKCLDDRQLNYYASGSIPATDLITAAAHVKSCECCRSRVLGMKSVRGAGMSVSSAVLGIADCPEYEELSEYVDGTLGHETHTSIDLHILSCELCAHDVDRIQAIRSRACLAPSMEVHPGRFTVSRSRSWFGWTRAAAIAGCAAAVAIVMFTRMQPVPNVTQTPAGPKVQPDAVAQIDPNVNNGLRNAVVAPIGSEPSKMHTRTGLSHKSQPAKAVYTVAMSDGDVKVTESNGKYTANIDEKTIGALVDRKLRYGKVPSSFQLAEAVSPGYRGPADVIDVDMLSPADNSIADSTPTFKWQPVKDADRYRVEIYALDGTPVIATETTNTTFKPSTFLAGGGYKWVVRMRSSEAADWKWSKSETFRVLSAKETELIQTAMREYPGSHLVLGSVYEHLGLKDEAVSEFKTLAEANPKSPLAGKLLTGALSAH